MAGILADAPLDDPDTAYMTLVTRFLPVGLRGLIVCGLFASLMSTVDSIFHSVSTLWSIDIYKRYLRPDASPEDVVRIGKSAIVGALVAGLLFAFLVVSLKTGSLQDDPLTHWFNELSYYVKNGFVVLVTAAVFLIRPSRTARPRSRVRQHGHVFWVHVGLAGDELSRAVRVGHRAQLHRDRRADDEAQRMAHPVPRSDRGHR